MSTKTKKKTTAGRALLGQGPETISVWLDDLVESPWNPRTTYDAAKLDELAGSLEEFGVLQPLVVRPHSGKPLPGFPQVYEIVCGHRRFRAAKKAGLETVPVIVRKVDDASALSIQLGENIQRASLSPMEEARAFRRLRDQHGLDVDEIAGRVGLGRSSVYERLRLLELPEAARIAVETGALPASTAGILCRIADPTQRERAAAEILGTPERGDEPLSFRAAQALIRSRYLLDLEAAPWDLEDANLLEGVGSCRACPKRTGNIDEAATLFDEERPGMCTDAACYGAKQAAERASRRAVEPSQASSASAPQAAPSGPDEATRLAAERQRKKQKAAEEKRARVLRAFQLRGTSLWPKSPGALAGIVRGLGMLLAVEASGEAFALLAENEPRKGEVLSREAMRAKVGARVGQNQANESVRAALELGLACALEYERFEDRERLGRKIVGLVLAVAGLDRRKIEGELEREKLQLAGSAKSTKAVAAKKKRKKAAGKSR